MSSRTPRVAAILAVVVATLVFVAPPGTARPGQTEPEGTIRLVQQSTLVEPNGDFAAFFEVSDVPAGSDLAVDIHPRIDTPGRLDDARAGTPRNSSATFPVIDLPGDPSLEPVQTGFVIQLSGRGEPIRPGGWSTRLTEPGAYPIRIRLRGPDNATIRTVVTHLVRVPGPDDEVETGSVALLADLDPGLDPEASFTGEEAPLDPEVVDAVTTVADTLAAHPEVAASLAIPPAVVRRLVPGDLTDGADEDADPGPTDDGPTSTEPVPDAGAPEPTPAERAVETLRSVLDAPDRELLGAPFVEIDPAELVGAGLSDELVRQQALGLRDLARLQVAPETGTWSVSRPLDTATVEALADAGVANLIVPQRHLVDPDDPSPARVLGADPSSLLVTVDPALTIGGHDDPLLAAHALLADLVALATITNGAAQVVTVSLPDTIEDVTELDAFLALLALDNPFLRPTTASALFDRSEDATERVALRAPSATDTGTYPDDLRAARRLVDAYASMVPDQPDLVTEVADPLSRTAVAGVPASRRVEQVQRQVDEIEARFAQVSIPDSDRVTLGARDAQFPLVVSSGSSVPLRVVVELTSASDRLTVVEPRVEVVLEGDRTVVPVRVRSRSPGDTPVRITVSTPDGQVLLSQGNYSVRSTAVSGMGIVLTIGAGLFLAVWWGRHFVRGRRAGPRHAR